MPGTQLTGVIRTVTALLLGAAILLTGNGVQVALLPIRADLEGFSQLDLGLLGAAYFAGLLAGSLFAPRITARVGHIRSFSAFTSIAVTAPLAQAVFISPPVWWGLRALTGICFAGLFMVIESWLNAAADRGTRGRILSTYTLLNLSVVTIGIQIVGFGDPRSFDLFALIAVLFSLAAVPVVLQVSAAPPPPRQPKLRLAWLFSVSPAAVMGCFVAGIANGAFWTYAPVFAARNGLDAKGTAMFLTAVVLGGAVTLLPIGYLSDRLSRRLVIAAVSALASLAGIGLYFESGGPRYGLIALGTLYGGMAYPLHAVCTAHANDLVLPKRAIEVSSGLLLMFSVGAILGPLMASLAIGIGGHAALFLTSATAHGAIAVVMVLRLLVRPRTKERKPVFVPVLETTPQAFDLAAPAGGEDRKS